LTIVSGRNKIPDDRGRTTDDTSGSVSDRQMTGKRGGAEKYNPHLKAALLEVVKNQLRANLTAERPDQVGAEL
jgi:hypothetical protein